MSPNLFAWAALFSWPAIAIAVYYTRRGRSSPARTTAWMMILPAMFLPANLFIEIPALPDVDKHRLSFLAILAGLYLVHRRELRGPIPHRRLVAVLTGALLLGVAGTALTNGDTLTYGKTVLPGLRAWDILAAGVAVLLDLTLPFYVGQRVFRTERDLRDLLEVLVLCGIIYLPLMLIEVRLSPQLHLWFYGYYPSDWVQSLRGGGYRPIVFMNHGLSVAMFLFTCLAAAFGIWRTRRPLREAPIGAVMAAFAVVLVLCKSLGAVLYTAAAFPLRLMISGRTLARTLVVVSLVVLSYPLARSASVFPKEQVIAAFSRINPVRAASLGFRLRNEEELVRRAMLRPVFGWGYFARSHIWTEWGQDVSVTDGFWIIQLGGWGMVGFLGFFTFLVVPVLSYARGRRRMGHEAEALVGTLALIVTFSTTDLIPNSRSDYLPVAYAGALLTLATTLRRSRREVVEGEVVDEAPPVRKRWPPVNVGRAS